MQIPVLIEPMAGSGFRARTGPPFEWSAEGATAAEALEKLRGEAAGRIAAGASVAMLEVPPVNDPLAELRAKGMLIEPLEPGANPWVEMAGTWKDDPQIDEFRRAIEDYRKEIDGDPNR
jgi:hypothetical protein